MRKILIAAGLLVASVFGVASPAQAVVCHEYSCCGEVVVLGKTIFRIDCAG